MCDVRFMDKVVLREVKVRQAATTSPRSTPRVWLHTHAATALPLPTLIYPHAQGGACEVYMHGGHITSWRTPSGKVRTWRGWGKLSLKVDWVGDGFRVGISVVGAHPPAREAASPPLSSASPPPVQDLLFLSKQAIFEPPKAIR
jgi:hypothetical protein